jgi:hypothetical protein
MTTQENTEHLEYISTPLREKVIVLKSPIPTKIPKGKTPVRCVGISPRKRRGNRVNPFFEKIYDKVVFIETEKLSSDYYKISGLVSQIMMKQKRCRISSSWGTFVVSFSIFDMEENKWEGFDVRK